MVRGEVEQGLEQVVRVAFDRSHPVALKQIRKRATHGGPVFDHVACSGRTARVVLKHEGVARRVADEIRPADVHVDAARHREVYELTAEVLGAEDQRGRDDPVLERLLAVVDFVEKKVQGRQPLDQAQFDAFPHRGRNDRGIRSNGKIRSVPCASL